LLQYFFRFRAVQVACFKNISFFHP